MRVFLRSRTVILAGLLALVAAAVAPVPAEGKPAPGQRRGGFRLMARTLGAITINRVALGLSAAEGNIGVDSTGSSVIGGGFWPRGTTNQFVFNSGLQVAGKINNPGGQNDGAVTGALFFNARGGSNGGEVQPIWNSSSSDDLANWPDAAKVLENLGSGDTVFSPVLLGRQFASQGDVWFMTWEGTPQLNAGVRDFPLGLAVESRGLGWNFPTGNEDIVYFLFTFYNVTSTVEADYAQVRPEMRPILLQLAAEFQARTPGYPAGGYTLDSLFVGFGADMDVSAAGSNFCSVNLPFALGYCYEHTFTPAGTEFYGDPTIWGPPFFPGPGFVGVKYLRSPLGAGEIQLFSNTINQTGGFQDPIDVDQLFRYLSGTVNTSLGDAACSFNPITDNICFINPIAADARFFQSSPALTLPPGGYGTIAVAYVFAAPVAVPGFVATSSTDVTPGPPGPTRLVQAGALASSGANLVDSLTGFLGYSDINGDNIVQQNEFVTVGGSLLNKSLTAQVVFDNRFLLPFSPDSPNFYLIPGDNSVTIAWQPSASEASGDPYFSVASDPGSPTEPNPLFDPNYRQFDVEGYRVYRGRVDAGNQLTLLAQFDYGGTFLTDFTGQVNPTPLCGPEFGVTGDCAVPFDYVQGSGVAPTVSIDYPLVGEVIQVKLGSASRVETAAGDLLIIANSDTLLTGRTGGQFPALADNGVPFSFEDRTARNGFRYFYAVTAFDVNSFQSGPASLESPRTTKSVTPQVQAGNVANLPSLQFEVTDPAGNPYTPGSFTINSATGIFSGPPPAVQASAVRNVTFQGAQTLWPFLQEGDLVATIDSVRIRGDGEDYPDEGIGAFDCQGLSNGQGLCAEYFLTYQEPGKPAVRTRTVLYQPILTQTFGDQPEVVGTTNGAAVPFDDEQLERFGVPSGVGSLQAAADLSVGQYGSWTAGENFFARRARGGRSPGGARWFSGANETEIHPAYSYRAGVLPGVDTIFAPLSHINRIGGAIPPASVCMQVYTYGVATFGRSADIEVVWGAGGTVTVRDLSNNLPVPFNASPSTGFGFVQDGNGNGVIDWTDIAWTEDMIQVHNHLGFCDASFTGGTVSLLSPSRSLTGILPEPGDGVPLTQTATLTPVSVSIPGNPAPANFVQTGEGFGIYLAGHYYVIDMAGAALPSAGTRWVLRSYHGDVLSDDATPTATPTNYVFNPKPTSPNAAGLRINYITTGKATDGPATSFDLTRVHTVPDPYFISNGFENTVDGKILKFVNLPNQAIIRIYTSSGILVNVLEHNSETFGGEITWNLRNRNNQIVASGVYFYHVESGDARKVGRFTVVNFAQ